MRAHRREKVESLIQHELSAILAREIDFPLGALVTLNRVEVTPDLAIAKVGVGVIPKESEENVLAILSKLRGYIQKLLTRKMNIKPMPQIEFELDRGSENAARIDQLLRDS